MLVVVAILAEQRYVVWLIVHWVVVDMVPLKGLHPTTMIALVVFRYRIGSLRSFPASL